MRRMTSQLRYVLRKLVRSPGFTLVSVVTLALGIGANTAIFSVVNGVLLKPLAFEEPEDLVGVWHSAPGLGFDRINQSPATYFTYREENRVFDDFGVFASWPLSVTGFAEPESVPAILVTDGVLATLRIRPLLGRGFTVEDDIPGSPETVILSYGYWQRQFGGDAAAVGQTLRVDGRPREIIGVMPTDLSFLTLDAAIYIPLRFDRSNAIMSDFSYGGVARLRHGVTIEAATQDLARMLPIAFERFPGGLTLDMLEEGGFAVMVHPLKDDVVGDVAPVLWILLGTVGLVLLIACANVTNLFLVRAEARQREVAIRTALGAPRGRIARQFLAESVVLGLIGGLAGLGVAYAGLRLLVQLAPENLRRADEIAIDPTVLLFTLGVSLFAGLLFGLFPVLQYGDPNLVSSLKEGGRGTSDGRESHRLRNMLATGEVALALVLLIGSGLMIRSFQALRDVRPGFERPEEVLTLQLMVPRAEVPEDDEAVRTFEQIYRRLEQIPGVTSIGLTTSITMDRIDTGDAVYVEDFPTPDNQLPPIRRFKFITGGYFETMENPVLAGRSISWADVHTRARVAVVTENFAREYWGEPNSALGERVRPSGNGPWREIVGVVGNVRDDGVSEGPIATVYWPMVVENFWEDSGLVLRRTMASVIRVGGREPGAGSGAMRPTSILPQVRDAIRSVNPNVPLASVRTLDEILAQSMSRTSFTLVMLGIAAVVAMVIGTVGIYGVISYIVAQRTRELGLRMALGARRGDVSRLVLRQGGIVAAAGVIIGLGAAFGLTRLMSALLYGVSAADPVTYMLAVALIALVCFLASYIPARRAAGVDPMEALRNE